MCRINPKVDFAFKKLFGSAENIDILTELVNSVLEQGAITAGEVFHPIEQLTLKNPYNLADYEKGKMSILDIKAQDSQGTWYDIEMQIAEQGYYDKRAFYYWAKMYVDQLESGKGYIELRKTVGIHLIDFDYLSEEANYHNVYRIYNVGSHKPLSDLFELHFIEMNKLTKPLTELRSKLERWVTFLNRAYDYEKNNIPAELAVDEQIKKAIRNLDVMYLDGKEREHYENDLKKMLIDQDTLQTAKLKGKQEGRQEGLQEGLHEGLKKGKQEEKFDVARRMLAKGNSIEDAAEIAGLSVEKVANLRY